MAWSKLVKAIKNPRRTYQFVSYRIRSPIQETIRRVDRLLGVRLLGGTQRFTQHRRGRAATAGEGSSLPISVDDSSLAAASKLDATGFHEFDARHDTKTIDAIRDRFEELLETGDLQITSGASDGNMYRRGITSKGYDVSEEFPEISDILTEDLRKLLVAYYGSWFKATHVGIWRNTHVPEDIDEEVYSDYWHIDEGRSTDKLKLFVYLTDVTGDHGPFHAVSMDDSRAIQSDTNLLLESSRHVPDGRVETEVEDVWQFTGQRGSMALCRTTTNLHRASNPAAGNHRDLLQIIFAPAGEPLPDDWLSHPDLKPTQ